MSINWDIKVNWDWHLIRLPTYGKYGGPGYVGGEVNPSKANYEVAPIDKLDALFKDHDKRYENPDIHARALADRDLLRGIAGLADGDFSSWGMRAYASACVYAFIQQIDGVYGEPELLSDAERLSLTQLAEQQLRSAEIVEIFDIYTDVLNFAEWLALSGIARTTEMVLLPIIYFFNGIVSDFPFGWPPSPPIPPLDPFVIDLDGDGIELISVDASAAHFDFTNDGFAERTGWLSGDDGFLFADENGNGLVDGIGELFGSASEDGFTELARSDGNGDGRIDAGDPIFSSLRIWQDRNGDGLATADEISTLSDHGIVSIGVTGEHISERKAGNEIRYGGDVTLSDGSSLDTGAVFFARNTTLSKWIGSEGFAIDPVIRDLPLSVSA